MKKSKNPKVQRLFKKLEKGVQDVFDSGRIKEFMRFQAKFHKYSFHNTMLIFVQCPEATLVAGFNTWNKMGRRVKKGEKAIKIFAPRMVKEAIKDKETGEEREETRLAGFKIVNVFDVSQTEGKPLPWEGPPAHDTRTGRDLLDRLLRISPVPVRTAPVCGEGSYDPKKKIITLSQKLKGDDRAKVLLHEIAHALAFETGKQRACRTRKCEEYVKGEVIAESAAFIAGTYFGLDMQSSFEYVAAWAKEPEKVLQWGEAVRKIASKIITLVEKADKKTAA